MRLFIAIQLSEEMKKSITVTMHDLKKAGVTGSYVPTQNLHLTLAFLGEVEDVEAVKAAMRIISWKSFRLSLSGLDAFGDTFWAGLKGNQGLAAAAKSVRDALDAAEISYDRQEFKPHITLVRRANGNWKKVPAPGGDMMVKKISLIKSTFRDGKPVYTEVFSI